MDLKVLYQLTYGLYIVGAFKDNRPVGCTINTCFQVTSENPRLVISLNKNNFTLGAIEQNKRFSLSILAENSDPAVIGKFGFYSSRDTDKYADFGYDTIEGAPCVKGVFAVRLILEAEQYVDCDTHVLVIGRLVDTVEGEGTPMTYAYYHKVIKGTAPKNAPTYQPLDKKEEEKAKTNRYKCQVCGYIAEFDGDMPDDYTCPVCGVDHTFFTKLD